MTNTFARGKTAENDSPHDPVIRTFRMATDDGESGNRKAARTFLLVDLGAALGYLRGRRGGSGDDGALVELVPESEPATESEGSGVLPKLLLLGVVAGIGYVLRRRSGSADELVDEAVDSGRSVADETEMRSGEAAGKTESLAERAADKIETTGEAVADRVRESGEVTADRIEEAGETAADIEEEAAESAEEMTSGEENGG